MLKVVEDKQKYVKAKFRDLEYGDMFKFSDTNSSVFLVVDSPQCEGDKIYYVNLMWMGQLLCTSQDDILDEEVIMYDGTLSISPRIDET